MIWLLAVSCTLRTYDQTPCDAPVDCRSAFGLGWTCGDQGMCQELEVPVRCDATQPADLLERPEDYADVLLLGALSDHVNDRAELNANLLPIIQVQDEGGLDGQDFGLVSCSYEEEQGSELDGLDPDQAAVAMAEFLVHELGAQVLIGPASSSKSVLVYDAVHDAGPLIISPSATSPALTTIDGETKTDDDPGLFWRTAPPDTFQGRAIAKDWSARGVNNVAVIHHAGAYGQGLSDVVLDSFEGAVQTWSFESQTGAIEALNDALADPLVEELLFITSDVDEVVSFLNAAASSALLGDRMLFLTDSAANQQILELTKDEVQDIFPQIRGSRPQIPSGPVYESFKTAYNGGFDGYDASDSVFTAFTYDATWLGIYGIAWSMAELGEVQGQAAARGLRHISAGEDLSVRPGDWEDVQAAFSAQTGVDLAGASGALDYDPATEETSSPIDIFAISPGGDAFVTCATWCWVENRAVECAQDPVDCDAL